MPKIQQPLRPIQVRYSCDKCGMDDYRPTDTVLTSHPPQYPHACPNCGDKKILSAQYPLIQFAKEGELLNLSED